MPVRNTLTRLRLALIRYAVFEARRNSVRGASVFCLELPFEIERDALADEHVHYGLGVMGVSRQSSASLDTFSGHAEHVFSVAEGVAPLPDVEEVSSSWQRSATKYGVDPVDNTAPRILASGELKTFSRTAGQAHLQRPGGHRSIIQGGPGSGVCRFIL